MRVVVYGTLLIALAGCVEIRPWQRGAATHPLLDPASARKAACEAFLRHTFDVREGATGGAGQAGGGCGCN